MSPCIIYGILYPLFDLLCLKKHPCFDGRVKVIDGSSLAHGVGVPGFQ